MQRGSLTLWFSAEVLTVWQSRERTGQRGHPRTYSDTAILTMATLQEIYHLGVRQTEGLVESMGELLHLEVAIPNYSTLSRRRATLEIELPRTRSKEALHVVVDSTGVKVFGEGEWKVRQHGYTYRRTWRKVHLGVDEASGEIVAAVVTTNNYSDSQLLPDLLEQVEEEIEQVSGDGGYDKRQCYEAIRARHARATIPPAAQRQDLAAWEYQGRPAGARSESAPDSAGRAGRLETREWVSSPELGGDRHVSTQDDF